MKWEKAVFASLFAEETRNGVYVSSDKHGSGVKIVNMGEVFSLSRIGRQQMSRVELSKQQTKRFLLENGDLLFARRSLVDSGAGKASIVDGITEPTTFESSIIRVRLDQSRAVPLFYYYWLQSHNGRTAIRALVTGTNVKGIRASELKNIVVDYPPLDVQKRLAEILSNYDNLIENNRKQIKLLEEAAQRLYQEWFVELHFPGHEHTPITDGVPEGFARCTLEDVIIFNPKIRLTKESIKQSVPMAALSTTSMVLNSNEFTLAESNSGSKFQNGDTLLARITPCLENGKTAFVSGIESEEGAVGSTEFIVMRADKVNPYMVYLLARTEPFRKTAINSMTGSDGRQRAQVDKLKAYEYLLPPAYIMQAFEKLVKPMFDAIENMNSQCQTLAEARDLLLPKLMNEEIEV